MDAPPASSKPPAIPTDSRGRRGPSTVSTTSAPYLHTAAPSGSDIETPPLLADFAAGYTTPYGSIPPPTYSRKGKARATEIALSCDECDAAALTYRSQQADEDESLSLSFARTRRASHARAKSIGGASSDGFDSCLSDGTPGYRPSTPRRIADEQEIRRRILRESRTGASDAPSSSRSSRDAGQAASANDAVRCPSLVQKRSRKARSGLSRSAMVGPLSLRAGGASQASTGTAAQYGRLLGHSILASASISVPEKSSLAATCAALPSLYKASRGRSANVSPSRRWDRRSASASILSRSKEASDPEALRRRQARIASKASPEAHRSSASSTTTPTRSRETSQEGALFPSDDEDDADLLTNLSAASDGDDDEFGPVGLAPKCGRSRRWSSVERDRRRGMRILMSPSNDADEERSEFRGLSSAAAARGRGRRSIRPSSVSSELTVTSECPSELGASASSCSSSSDIAGETRRAMEALAMAIPIGPRSTPRSLRSPGGAFSFPHGSGSASIETSAPSLSSSALSNSLVQQSPPPAPHTTIKPIIPVPVLSGSDPLLGITMNSIEDMIEVDQVEFCREDSASETEQRSTSTSTAAKRTRKLSWIIGDLNGDDDEEKPTLSTLDASPPPQQQPPSSSQSYQARLAGQFRLWRRGQDDGRQRQASTGSDDGTEAAAAASYGLLSNSWRSLARLPNLILLPGLAARQARDAAALAAASPASQQNVASGAVDQAGTMADLASIFRHASCQGPLSEEDVEARRQAALRMGRPPSPSPSPSPPASLSCSRQSSSESVVGISHRRSSSQPSPFSAAATAAISKKGRGVATPIEGDHDPSAYVSGLGQPIDPDTELASVVHLQTFRSRSRSRSVAPRSTDVVEAGRRRNEQKQTEAGETPKSAPADVEKHAVTGKGANVDASTSSERPSHRREAQELSVVIPTFHCDSLDDGARPTDIASAPTSPTYHRRKEGVRVASDSSSGSGSSVRQSEEDEDGFRRFQSRRQRRRSSGPRSTRPRAESLVPRDFSAFAIDEVSERETEEGDAEGQSASREASRGDDDGDASSSDSERMARASSSRARSRGRQGRSSGRGRDCGGRDTSPPRIGKRQCAVGLFGGGVSSRRRDGAKSPSTSYGHSAAIRSVRSSPDLTYAAAAARFPASSSSTDSDEETSDGVSPPRGSRGRRGAVKVVSSSVGQTVTCSKALTMNNRLHRGPSYPPRAGDGCGATAPSAAAADNTNAGPSGHGAVFASPPTPASTQIRLRLLSNSSHLLMLSLELEMIKKHKISGPLRPRWGKHRANDFVPLPNRREGDRLGAPLTLSGEEGSKRDVVVGSRLKYSWAPCSSYV